MLAIFEGPVRPLTREDQEWRDEQDRRYEERVRIRREEHARILGVSLEEVIRREKTSLLALAQEVAMRRAGLMQ